MSSDEERDVKHENKTSDDEMENTKEERDVIKDIFGSDTESDEEHNERENEETFDHSLDESISVKTIQMPTLPAPPEEAELIYFRLPNVLSIEPTPFNIENFREEYENKDARKIASHAIRWRYNENGEKESNARIIKWSDGSIQLKVGNEFFDISQQDMSDAHVHLFARLNEVIYGQGKFTQKMTFKPHSILSIAHKKLANTFAEKTSRKRKTRLTLVLKDPEADQKQKEEQMKTSERISRKQAKKMREGVDNLSLTEDALLDETGEGDVSIRDIKKKYRKRGRDIDDDEGEEIIKKAKTDTPSVSRKKAERYYSDDEEEEYLDQETDEEDDY